MTIAAAFGVAARGRLALLGRMLRVLPLAALTVVSGCFATRSDVRIVQSDVVALRTELLRKDAEQNATLAKAMTMLAAATDSLARISTRTIGIQGDVRGEMRAVKEQLLQVQTLLGQSQANINRIRAELEARAQAAVVQPPPAPTGTPTAPGSVSGGTPPGAVSAGQLPVRPDTSTRSGGASQLYQQGMDVLRSGAPQSARTAFQELLSNFPTSDLAPDAQFQIGQSLLNEKNYGGADAAFGAVVAKYADSPRAPAALFKRATIAKLQGNMPEAKKLLQEVISRFPKSDEAELAADELKLIK